MKKTDNAFYEIVVSRNSVCMADDINDNRITIRISKACSIKDFIRLLGGHSFFPSIQGNNIAWTLTINKNEVATYYTKTSNIILIDNDYWEENKKNGIYDFNYYSPIEKRLYCIQDKRVPINNGLLKEIKHIDKIK